jgi:hypothetical protein
MDIIAKRKRVIGQTMVYKIFYRKTKYRAIVFNLDSYDLALYFGIQPSRCF